MKVMKIITVFLCTAALFTSCVSENGVNPPDDYPPAGQSGQQTSGVPADTGFVVTKEHYDQTFAEVESLILLLNEIIRTKNYDEWLRHLSPEYVAATGNPEFLREASQSPILVKSRIVLKDLKDYFLYVVVPSRSQAILHDISFIDENHVKAMTVIDGKAVILYMLSREGASWMVGVW